MNKNTIWTILGVILAVIIAWWLVNVIFSLLWFVVKLALVAAVALAVYVALRALFRRVDD